MKHLLKAARAIWLGPTMAGLRIRTRRSRRSAASGTRRSLLYVVNGELDPLCPAMAVHPYMVMLRRAGADLTFKVMGGAGHDTSWWPAEADLIDAFEAAH